MTFDKKPDYLDYYLQPEDTFCGRGGYDFEQYETDLKKYEDELQELEDSKTYQA